MHMAAASIHLMAAVAIGGTLGSTYGALLAAVLLAVPMIAALVTLAGLSRLGSILFGLSFVGMAGLMLYGQLGQGWLQTALNSGAHPWKTLFFATAMLMTLLQITGIMETAKALAAGDAPAPLIKDLQ